MTFQPIITPILLILLFAPLLYLTVRAIFASTTAARRWLWAERTLLVALCFTMLMRPGLTGATSQTVATNTDIYLVVDTTASMVAEDWNGDKPRIDGVREDIKALVAAYPGARFSLITFASNAETRLPLTTDASALTSSLEVMRPETTSVSRGSDIGAAAPALARALEKAAAASTDRSRMVFYFGDGEQTSNRTPVAFDAAKSLVDGGVVFGYGTTKGAPMKITSGLATDGPSNKYIEYNGKPAISVVDESKLKTIADQLGVQVQMREASAKPSFPPAPTTSTTTSKTVTASETAGGIFDLSWVFALAVMALVAFELARATMLATMLRALSTAEAAKRRKEVSHD